MTYRFATGNEDYADFAAGAVLYNMKGATSFPVRLADEIFLRAKALLQPQQPTPYRLYDPCCGTGYLLTVLGLRHGQDLAALYGSDINSTWVDRARENLSLLTPEGVAKRQLQIEGYLAAYGKDSHRQALQRIERLKAWLPSSPIDTRCFTADALQPVTEIQGMDMVITDVPYGQMVGWKSTGSQHPVYILLDALRPALKSAAVVAIVTDKSVKVRHESFNRAARFQIGKRQITLLMPAR